MWSFVGKKQKNCDPLNPDDEHKGDWWDHVAYDPQHKLVLAVVPGARVTESVEEVVGEVKDRLDGQSPDLMTSDEYPVYETVIETAFSQMVVAPQETAGPGGRPLLPQRCLDPGVTYATGAQKAAEQPRRGRRSDGRAGDPRGGGPSAEGVGVQPDDQHVVRGASARDGAGSECPSVATDVPVQ